MPPTETPQPAVPTDPPLPTPTAAPTQPLGTITINGGSAEVWAWEKQVRGNLENAVCDTVQVRAGEQVVEAPFSQGAFEAAVPLKPGENVITATCGEVASEPVTYTAKLPNSPIAIIAINIANGKVLMDGSGSRPASVNPAHITEYRWGGDLVGGDAGAASIEITPPGEDGEYYFSLTVKDEAGREDTARIYFVVEQGAPRIPDYATENAAWIEDAVVYGVIPRKFGSEGFKSIEARLDALKDLGINALWLAPINRSPNGDYGYGVIDYFEIRERLGTKEDFRAFVQAAHQRGIRVLMDFVPNHSSIEHPYYQDAAAKGEESHYWNFYDRDANGDYTYYFQWQHLPNLNYSNPEVVSWMIEAMIYWVREFDVDGYRVDACWGVQQRRPEFWPWLRALIKRVKPDVLLLAEASARDPYWFTEGFDAAYDWTDALGHWAWEMVYEDRDLLLYNLRNALTNGRKGFHEDALIFRFLNNNDTGGRFITVQGVDMAKVSTLMLLTLPGVPCIYTGDEIGAAFTPYGDPLPLNWEKDPQGMFEFHKELIALRHNTPALHSRPWQLLNVDPRYAGIAYLRWTGENENPILVLLNFSEEASDFTVTLPEAFAEMAQTPLHDLLTGESVSFANGAAVTVPPMWGRVLSL